MTIEEFNEMIFHEIDNLRDLRHKIKEPTAKDLQIIIEELKTSNMLDDLIDLKIYLDDLIFELLGE